MPLSHIEHFLVAADDIDATRDWYARVLGMRSGPHPDFGFPVHWMYIGDVDVVHIGPSAKGARPAEEISAALADAGPRPLGARPHRLPRDGLTDDVEHLGTQGVPFSQRRANGQAVPGRLLLPQRYQIELNTRRRGGGVSCLNAADSRG